MSYSGCCFNVSLYHNSQGVSPPILGGLPAHICAHDICAGLSYRMSVGPRQVRCKLVARAFVIYIGAIYIMLLCKEKSKRT